MSYTSSEIITHALDKLKMKPSVSLVTSYSNDISKRVFGAIGILGKESYRAIVGSSEGFSLFFIKLQNDYQLVVEHPSISGHELKLKASKIENQFRIEYAVSSLEALQEIIEGRGEPARIVRSEEIGVSKVVLEFGPMYTRSVSIVVGSSNQLVEEVHGVSGKSCGDLTGFLESLLSVESEEIHTEWKAEYNESIEDHVVQVLSLGA